MNINTNIPTIELNIASQNGLEVTYHAAIRSQNCLPTYQELIFWENDLVQENDLECYNPGSNQYPLTLIEAANDGSSAYATEFDHMGESVMLLICMDRDGSVTHMQKWGASVEELRSEFCLN